MSNFKSV